MTHQKELTEIELALKAIISNGMAGLDSSASLRINDNHENREVNFPQKSRRRVK